MYLGINTHFIMRFDFEQGLKFCQDIGVKGMEVAAGGQAAKEYCDLANKRDKSGLSRRRQSKELLCHERSQP